MSNLQIEASVKKSVKTTTKGAKKHEVSRLIGNPLVGEHICSIYYSKKNY